MRKTILSVGAVLFGFSGIVFGWGSGPPDCGPCNYWDYEREECVTSCGPLAGCCGGSCCSSSGCKGCHSGQCKTLCSIEWGFGPCCPNEEYHIYCCDPCYDCVGENCVYKCSSSQKCCDDGHCCPEDDTCCGGDCCMYLGETCCNGTCCDLGHCCNGELCCGSNEHCCTDSGSYCCPDNKVCCGGDCCDGLTETCCNGVCYPKCENSYETGECDAIHGEPFQCPECAILFGCAMSTTKVYSDNRVYNGCSGGCPGECDDRSTLCYTEYACDAVLWPLYFCMETVPGQGKSCHLDPSGGCFKCYQDIDIIGYSYADYRACE